MKKRWIIYKLDNALMCPCCGGDIEVFTDLDQEMIDKGMYQDGDSVRCIEFDCDSMFDEPMQGSVSCDSETKAWINDD